MFMLCLNSGYRLSARKGEECMLSWEGEVLCASKHRDEAGKLLIGRLSQFYRLGTSGDSRFGGINLNTPKPFVRVLLFPGSILIFRIAELFFIGSLIFFRAQSS
jgi:hypothetical protein